MRVLLAGLALVGLAACDSAVPNSAAGTGVGFGTPNDFRAGQAARDAALERPLVNDQTQLAVDTVIDGAGADQAEPTSNIGTVTAGLGARSGEISDEQNFDAVAGRETIESDAARIQANRQQMTVIQPTALPTRSQSGPNIVEFALSSTNQKGESVYRRSGLSGEARALRNCSEYASADLAQQDFLRRGGPRRDRLGLDPDGDGFACAWDPAPFRVVSN
ncbi:MAG: hypothetical protein MK180_12895 [Rhodobacteraceae bacterium]|nr:hypothetical protein [Paracoccaceae bacterium]